MDFFIAAANDTKFRRPVVPGDVLELHAEIVRDRGTMLVIKCAGKVNGQVVVETEILAKVALQSARGDR